MQELLLDTDTISLFLKNYPKVMAAAHGYLSHFRGFTFSAITRYEILRGLKIKDAHKQISQFEIICGNSRILEINDKIIVRALDIYADLYQRGQIIGDADIFIAATALENNLAVVTNNESHFNRITNLRVLNWNT